MANNYYEGQPVAYSILKNEIEHNTVAHAYLFASDNLKTASNFALCFAKTLLCPKNSFNDQLCDGCSICHRIDNGNYPELKIIEPDGLWIKKDQLLKLQEDFRTKPLEGDKKIYIIIGADKLNVQAANSILKFIEEPEANIIALLTTDDIHGILPTIISRCQIISLKSDDETNKEIINFSDVENKTLIKIGELYNKDIDSVRKYVDDAKNVTKLEAIVNFLKKYESLKSDVLLETKKLWNDNFVEKDDYVWALDIMALFYKDVLNVMYNRKIDLFCYYSDIVEKVASLNKPNNIIRKIQKILLIKEKVKYNINLNLLIDKLVIEMERGDKE